MRWVRRVNDERILTLTGVVAWVAAVLLGVFGHAATAAAFVLAGVALFTLRALSSRMGGETSVGPDGIKTNLIPAVGISGDAADEPPTRPGVDLDPSKLVARWPTLAAALEAIPVTWTKERLHHDGQEFLHVRTPQAGYELVINTAALDSAAPQWLMAAISVMETTG